MDYTKAIEALDQKWGRPVNLDDWHALDEKSAAALTDDDLVVLGYFAGPKHAAERRAQRALALNPPAPPPAAPALPAEAGAITGEPQTLDELRKRYGKQPVTLDVMLDGEEVLIGKLKQHRTQIDALSARVADLEGRPQLKWAGIYREGAYAEASLITHHGSLWVAEKQTTDAPGVADSGWRLVCKRVGA